LQFWIVWAWSFVAVKKLLELNNLVQRYDIFLLYNSLIYFTNVPTVQTTSKASPLGKVIAVPDSMSMKLHGGEKIVVIG